MKRRFSRDGETPPPTGTIEEFFDVLSGSPQPIVPMTIDEMNAAAAAGWAGTAEET